MGRKIAHDHGTGGLGRGREAGAGVGDRAAGRGAPADIRADFTVDPVADLLVSAGLDPGRPSLFLLEGVAVYLEEAVLRSLLAQLRRIAANGSRLAISLLVSSGSPERAARRAAFQAAVAAMGEPARSVLETADAGALLEATGWRPVPEPGAEDRAGHAGFIVAAPITLPATP
jgi:O-methyltransferase involved in polyketide biosynthesis